VTLVELITVLVMASVVLAIGVPSLQELMQRNRLTADTNRFMTSMMLARSEAIKRGTPTGIVAQGGDWNDGWVVWLDANADGAQDMGELVLRSEEEVKSSVTLSSQGGVSTFQYAADGTLDIPNNPHTLDVCDGTTTGETGRQISLWATGRVSVDSEHSCP
jgi:type IV fimbrial biogenesis protein FimT